MRNLKLTVAYDGTDFHGFQVQRGSSVRTVQQALTDAWAQLTGEVASFIGAGRTDAGVHAEGQVVNVRTHHMSIPEERVPYAMNSVMDQDVRVVGCQQVPQSFHARFDAVSKVYEYRVYNRPFPSPLHRRYTHFVATPLDLGAMAEAGSRLVGRRDFAALAGHHDAVRTTVRTLMRCDVKQVGDIVSIELEADGFLYHMARRIVGTLLCVGKGEQTPDWITHVLNGRDPAKAGPTAPACGLILRRVDYATKAKAQVPESARDKVGFP